MPDTPSPVPRPEVVAPSYRIATLNDFLAVPEDRLGACLVEFADWIELSRRMRDLMQTLAPDVPKDKLMTAEAFVWTDDGERNVAMTLHDDQPEPLLRVDYPEHGETKVHIRTPAPPPGAEP